MPRILITGSRGFIGRHLSNSLDAECMDIGDLRPQGSFDGIIHLAAISRVAEGEKNTRLCMETNILETVSMLEIPHKWFILASTTDKPRNVYGLSKRCAEDYLKLRSDRYIILRMANVYGPGMAEDKFLPMLRRKEIKTIYPATYPFEHIHVSDVVAQILALIPTFERPFFKPFTMKLATGIAKTEEELRRVAHSY